MKSLITLITILSLVFLTSACMTSGDEDSTTLETELGVNSSNDSTSSSDSTDSATSTFVRIIESGTGAGDNIDDLSLIVGSATTLRAALYDINQNYISDVSVFWSISGTSLPTTDLSPSGLTSSVTFTPSSPGTVIINASYTGSDSTVTSKQDTTGTITIQAPQVVNSLAVVSGDAQTGIVNANLSLPLIAIVKDSFGFPIQGKSVLFSVTLGSGAIIGTNPVTTDLNGYAQVTAQLGTNAGSGNNIYRATSVEDGSKFIDFSAISTNAAADHFTFTTDPSIAFANNVFGVQPVAELRDQYENLISSSDSVVLSLINGSGTLSGTTTVSMVNGVVTWSDIQSDTSETTVQVRATGAGVTGDSSSFDVGSAPAGACVNNDASFQTAGGGCKDLSTGLVWSARSGSTMNWGEAMWDVNKSGSPTIDIYDYSKTNHYNRTDSLNWYDCPSYTSSNSGFCDYDSAAYCKTLTEGGELDWRLPSSDELLTVHYNMLGAASGVSGYLDNVTSTNIWASEFKQSQGSYRGYVVNLSTGVLNNNVATRSVDTAQYSYCVRDDDTTATNQQPAALSIESGPITMGTGYVPSSAVRVKVIDGTGQNVNVEGLTITLASASTGNVAGTTSLTTNRRGFVDFDSFTLDGSGAMTLTFDSTGLTSVTHSLENVGSAQHSCRSDSGNYTTADGGCEYIPGGLIWSLPSASTLNWHQIIWGYDSGTPFNTVPETSDGARENDYDSDTAGATVDNSTTNYCHELVESGKSDWRTPTRNELDSVSRAGNADTHFGFELSTDYYCSSTTHSTSTRVWSVRLTTGASSYLTKTTSYQAICVRDK